MENVNQSLSSGASKRRKRKRLEAEKSKLPKITTFLIDCSGTTGDEGEISTERAISVSEVAKTVLLPDKSTEFTEGIGYFDDDFLCSILKEAYPTDLGHFENRTLTDKIKMFIVNQGPCQPDLQFPKDDRTFKKIKVHAQSQNHVSSCFIYDQWKSKKGMIDEALMEDVSEERHFWKEVLHRIIDITLALAKNSLAFRGHRENITDVYNGNFLTFVNLLSKYDPFMKELVSRPREERSHAISLLKSLEQFEFIFILTMCSKILENANIASKLLQLDDLDLSRACKSLESTYTKIKEYRDDYDQLKTEATNVAAKWSIQPKFQEKRNITSKKKFGEPNTQYLFSEREHFFKVNIYYKTLDIVLCQIKNRFEAMNTTVSKFNFLNPKLLVEMSEADLFRSSENLQKLYPSDLSSTFPLEIISLLPLKEEIVKLKDIREFAELLIIMNYTLSSNFSEIGRQEEEIFTEFILYTIHVLVIFNDHFRGILILY
ncbi:hypothetical protein JTB14_035566 [Gonioctena quinquepunctata]|nr:hypothetical protein JTB14_035566 [Gonioctena quinquepunctata]